MTNCSGMELFYTVGKQKPKPVDICIVAAGHIGWANYIFARNKRIQITLNDFRQVYA